jgi:hypothetical protein
VNPPITTTITGVSVGALTNSTDFGANFVANQTSAVFVCSIDNSVPATCSSSFAYSGFSEGAHSFEVRALDAFGDADPVGASYSWTIDNTAPVVLTAGATPGRTSVTITWTTNEPSTSKLQYGPGSAMNLSTQEQPALVSNHSVTITGWSPNTQYSYVGLGRGSERKHLCFDSSNVSQKLLVH